MKSCPVPQSAGSLRVCYAGSHQRIDKASWDSKKEDGGRIDEARGESARSEEA